MIYGEGWSAGDSRLPVERRALKENVAKMKGIAVFSDDIRDAVKGHYSREEDRGFASGKPGLEETVKIGIVASTAHPQVDYSKGNNSKFAYATSPEQIMNYVSCHDDLCLTDKMRKSMPDATDSVRMRVARLHRQSCSLRRALRSCLPARRFSGIRKESIIHLSRLMR